MKIRDMFFGNMYGITFNIACPKRNPKAELVGIDRWGKEYASFSKQLCENNSKAEGVSNTSFMQAFAKKLKDMGYEEVKLIDTTKGMFMGDFEALWMELSGSTLLVGRK